MAFINPDFIVGYRYACEKNGKTVAEVIHLLTIYFSSIDEIRL